MASVVPHLLVNIVCVSFLVLHFAPAAVVCAPSLKRLYLPDPGPESFAFDHRGEGPYTGVADGRVLKYKGPSIGFVEYAHTAPHRSGKHCDGSNDTKLIKPCGRPLGMEFYRKTGELFIADAAYGLVVVKPGGGLAKQLASGIKGVPFCSPDGLDVDQNTGKVYFSEASMVYNLSQITNLRQPVVDETGRVLKYNPKTKRVSVLMTGLGVASGVAVSKDSSFLLATENMGQRIRKYWLKGPRKHTSEVLLNLPGHPNKIKRNEAGDFWVAVTVVKQKPKPTTLLQGVRIHGNGTILQTLTFGPELQSSLISEVQEFRGSLYLGSLYVGYVCTGANH